jgi:hypothetical protein
MIELVDIRTRWLGNPRFWTPARLWASDVFGPSPLPGKICLLVKAVSDRWRSRLFVASRLSTKMVF